MKPELRRAPEPACTRRYQTERAIKKTRVALALTSRLATSLAGKGTRFPFPERAGSRDT